MTATYTVATQDDQFTARDNGRYVIDVMPYEVSDTLGQSSDSLAAGEVRVDVGVRLPIEIEGSQDNRYFSFASMAIPSNDAFLANLNSRQYELFDSLGNFHGACQITLYGRDILDAGTEVNDPLGGAAYSTGGGVLVDENGVIRPHGAGRFCWHRRADRNAGIRVRRDDADCDHHAFIVRP